MSEKGFWILNESDKVFLASKAYAKNWSYERLQNCEELYGEEHLTDSVWKYVVEMEEGGVNSFLLKYKRFEMY